MKIKKEIGEKYLKTVAIITYLVENVQISRERVGKTCIQKLMFLLERALKEDFDFRFHYYGPYSSSIDSELNYASFLKSVNIRWGDNFGYLITTGENASVFTEILSGEEKSEIESVAKKYGKLSAKDLSVIASAYYLMENSNISGKELIHAVGKLKSYDEKRIQELLDEYGVLDEKLTI